MKTPIFRYLLILLVITSIEFKCSNDDSISKKQYYLNFSVLGERTFRTLIPTAETDWLAQKLDSTEQHKISPSFKIEFGILQNATWRIFSGLMYSDQGEKTIKTDFTDRVRYRNHYHFVGLRLGIGKQLNRDNFNWYGAASLIPSYLISTKQELMDLNSTQTNIFNIATGEKKFMVAADINLGILFNLSKNCRLDLSCYYRRSLTSINPITLKKVFYAYGINIGFTTLF